MRKWSSSRVSTFCFLSVSVLIFSGLMPENSARGQEGVCQGRFASIHYLDPAQLERFAQKIQPNALTVSLNQIFLAGGKTRSEPKAGTYVDQLFQRVQTVLEMHKPDLKVQIRLFRNQQDLSEVFERITQRPTQSPAFYWKEDNTIYVQMEKVSVGILAHEMSHAVIEHYFIIPPPEKISELLCQYVDREISKGNF